MAEQVRVLGLPELRMAFAKIAAESPKVAKAEARTAGKVVSVRAQSRAVSEISHIGSRWSRMRVGVTSKSVYVAPSARRSVGPPRPNLAGLLMDKAMQPALDETEEAFFASLELSIDRLGATAGF